MGLQCGNQCMSDFMIRYNQFFFCGKYLILLLISGNNRLNTLFKIRLCYKLPVLTNRPQCRFIHHIRQLRSGCPGCCSCDRVKVNVISQSDLFRMNFQDFFSSFQVRKFHRNPPVKSSRS